MGPSAGFSIAGKCDWRDMLSRWNSKPSSVPMGSGNVAVIEKSVCELPSRWARRWHVSVSAGFRMDHKSSLTEITGNRMTMSMASATSEPRRPAAVRRPSLGQQITLTDATSAHTKLEKSSMPIQDSISAEYSYLEFHLSRRNSAAHAMRESPHGHNPKHVFETVTIRGLVSTSGLLQSCYCADR